MMLLLRTGLALSLSLVAGAVSAADLRVDCRDTLAAAGASFDDGALTVVNRLESVIYAYPRADGGNAGKMIPFRTVTFSGPKAAMMYNPTTPAERIEPACPLLVGKDGTLVAPDGIIADDFVIAVR